MVYKQAGISDPNIIKGAWKVCLKSFKSCRHVLVGLLILSLNITLGYMVQILVCFLPCLKILHFYYNS